MNAIILMGIQGSGKSTFYRQRFFDTHMRLNLDMLKTRHREKLLLGACLAAKQRFVVDNTNVRREDRARYIPQAQARGFKVIGYFFEPRVERALKWNAQREGKAVIPVKGVLGTLKRLERPALDEGFDELFRVEVADTGEFVAQPWDAVP